jgi:hypothetical protein
MTSGPAGYRNIEHLDEKAESGSHSQVRHLFGRHLTFYLFEGYRQDTPGDRVKRKIRLGAEIAIGDMHGTSF